MNTNINWNGVRPILRLGVALRYFWVASRYLNHSSGADNFVSNGIRVRFILSTCRLPLGTPVVIRRCIFSSAQYFLNIPDVKAVPWSDIILYGFPKIVGCLRKRSTSSTVSRFHSVQPYEFTKSINYNKYMSTLFLYSPSDLDDQRDKYVTEHLLYLLCFRILFVCLVFAWPKYNLYNPLQFFRFWSHIFELIVFTYKHFYFVNTEVSLFERSSIIIEVCNIFGTTSNNSSLLFRYNE